MIIECPYCESKVDAKILAEREYPPDDERDSYKVSFLECAVCKTALVAGQDLIQTDFNEWAWADASRLWPQPTGHLHFSIPRLARVSLQEAKKCFSAQAYAASVVMCGRAIEAVCVEHKTKAKTLAAGLRELRDRKIIDQRLFDWGDALRAQRNIGAHATEEDISHEDARDVLDFAVAICEYVFVLSEKYEEFQARQRKKKGVKATAAKKSLPSGANVPKTV